MSVMVVISGSFPYTYSVLYMTVNWWCAAGVSWQRHGEIGLGKRFCRYHDGDDAHDGHLRVFSKEVARLLCLR
jgi:hypothetical protein